tara:strand:+ start:401 stop:1057 length:657 start_codon:yes stop_codon:yes gene_type:complete
MRISYAIPVCNELEEIKTLVSFLLEHKREEDEIVVLFDETNGTPEVEQYLDSTLSYYKKPFNGDFSEHKNYLKSLCTGEWIFQIDADELPTYYLIQNLPGVLQENPTTDLFLVPRINTVKGLTQEHITKWGWRVDEKGWVNFPDYQTRILQNNPKINWGSKVHEVILGHDTYAPLPAEEEWCILHNKQIDRQISQNEFYESLGELSYAVGDGIDPRAK